MSTLISSATLSSAVTKAVTSATPTSTFRATPQGGILEGSNPSHYNPKDPIITFIIQAGIIIIFCRLLHYPLSFIRQPRVIAEVIGGILLGPSVMGRIPGFTAAIFPAAAQPNLALVANLGLVLFLFLVGLEVDLRFVRANWRIALSVGVAGMALPFGFGAAIAWGLYNQFHGEPGTVAISFGVYMLFIGVAMAITAFPVLCRILTELKLLQTPVGIIVLSAGVGNDVVGWILLALCVALVNAGTGLSALWVLLTALGYVLFLTFAVRPAFYYVLKRTRALSDGPSQGIVALTLLIVLTSSFFTGIIGVHPIFGAFMAGLICPHEGGFAIKLTEKLEDLVGALLLPLYFALSGLNTNLGLLDSGIVWGYVIGIISVAFFAKFIGAAVAARLTGCVWRESFAIGSLMSCKGLVELIVLNIGLQAKILSTRTFTMFVIMALVTTFATTPLTRAFYPQWYQRKLEAWKRGEIDWDTGKPPGTDASSIHDSVTYEKMEATKMRKMLVYLRLDNMPSLLAFMTLLGGSPLAAEAKQHPSKVAQLADSKSAANISTQEEQKRKPIEAHAVRLLELTDRSSSVMKVSQIDEYSVIDPVVNTFRTFGRMHNVAVSGEVAVLPENGFADALVHKAADLNSDLLLLPWSETGSLSDAHTWEPEHNKKILSSSPYTSFIAETLNTASCNTAIFLSRGFGGSSFPTTHRERGLTRTRSATSIFSAKDQHATVMPLQDTSHHIFCAFFGGPDDRIALRLVLQLAESPDVTASIIHFKLPEGVVVAAAAEPDSTPDPSSSLSGHAATDKTPAAATLPAIDPQERDAVFFSSLRASIPGPLADRVVFSVEGVSASHPFDDVLARLGEEVGQSPRNAGDLIVLGRRVGKTGGAAVPADRNSCLGGLASEVCKRGVRASVVVVQAGYGRE